MADQYLKQDGSVFLFKPGDNGSLTNLKKQKPTPWDVGPTPPVAKIVPQINDSDEPEISTKHGYSMNGEHVQVGSSRG